METMNLMPTRYHDTYLSVFTSCQVEVPMIWHPGAHMAKFLDVTNSALAQTENLENLGEIGKYS